MSVTAKDIAKALNISAAAVSMALNNKPGVSDELRAKIFSTANEMGFKYSKKMLRKNHKMIAVMFMHKNFIFDSAFFSEVGNSIEYRLKEHGYRLNAYHIHEHSDIQKEIEKVINDDPDGIILFGTLMMSSDIHYFNHLSIPVLLLDAYFSSFDGDSVVINNMEGARSATEYLIDHCNCCPGYIRSSNAFPNTLERADGFFKAIRNAGYHSNQVIMHEVIASSENSYADMIEIIDSKEPLANAYFCDNDEIAIGAIRAFKDRGYRIPEDISIIGFDNMNYSAYVTPPLTSINVPKVYMGKIAADRLMETIQSEVHYPIKIAINTNLVIRKSVK
ncbi:MAG: LacI family transcriptional regulator [Erysipelotrichaceae bacterium]|nr:LacI family transcriptional regulator [Erysipelotrichaceae bacterium]MDY6035495.1 LacI family DNA-binding transcriptional regulator [Bulleidia sp.]